MAHPINKTTIRFEQRTYKADKTGKAPIRIIYQISGQRKFASTTLKCLPANWDNKQQEAIYITKEQAKKLEPVYDYDYYLSKGEVNDFNSKLQEYTNDIRDIEKRFRREGTIFKPSMVLEEFSKLRKPFAAKDDIGKSVVALINQFVKDSASTHKPGTLKVYTGLANHLSDFEKQSGRKTTFQKIDIPFLRSFHAFLCTDRKISRDGETIEIRGMNNITAAKQLSTLKTILKQARTQYNIEVNPSYRDYSITRKDTHFEVITLTWDEFETLFNLDLSNNKKLMPVRDVFCFSCSTGLRYSDLAQLKREHVRGDSIKMTAAKTSQKLVIPLNIYSATILDRYKDKLKPLPIISNQKTNQYLKELCELAKIDTPIEIVREYGIKKVSEIYPKYQLISIHVGRKTFTTLSLEKGIAPQEVMALTGHSQWKSFKRYVDVSEKQKKAVMAKAWGESKTHLKAV